MPISMDEVIPSYDTVWVSPFDEHQDFQIELRRVEARELDIILRKTKVRIRVRNNRGRFIEEEAYSQDKTAQVYAKDIFLNFKGMVDKSGKEVENTYEKRVEMLRKNNSLLSFIIDFAHDEGNYMAEKRQKDEEDFLPVSKSSPKSSSTQSASQ